MMLKFFKRYWAILLVLILGFASVSYAGFTYPPIFKVINGVIRPVQHTDMSGMNSITSVSFFGGDVGNVEAALLSTVNNLDDSPTLSVTQGGFAASAATFDAVNIAGTLPAVRVTQTGPGDIAMMMDDTLTDGLIVQSDGVSRFEGNMSLRGSEYSDNDAVVFLDGGSPIPTANRKVIKVQGLGTAVVIGTNVQLEAGEPNQIVYLTNLNDSDTVTLQSTRNLPGSNLFTNGHTRITIGAGDVYGFMYSEDLDKWLQISGSDN